MNKYLIHISFFLFLFVFACEEDDENNTNLSGDPAVLQINTAKAQLDGEEVIFSDMIAGILFGELQIEFSTVSDAGPESIQLIITNYNGTNMYRINQSSNLASYKIYTDEGFEAYDASSGAIEITREEEGLIMGRFEFEAKKADGTVKSVTNGLFKAQYSVTGK